MTTSEPADARRFPLALTVVTAAALALLISLGVWQVKRLAWKEGLIAAADAAGARPAEPLAAVLSEDGDPEFRKVTLDCPALGAAPYVELRTISDGRPGVRLVSACRVAGRTWLVDRGFVAEEISARPPTTGEGGADKIVAVVRLSPPPGAMTPAAEGRLFYGRDMAAMARALGAAGPVAPQTLYAVTSSNPEWQALEPSAPPVAFSNNHLGYALTWFGLAIALMAIYLVLLRRRLRS